MKSSPIYIVKVQVTKPDFNKPEKNVSLKLHLLLFSGQVPVIFTLYVPVWMTLCLDGPCLLSLFEIPVQVTPVWMVPV